MTYTEEIYRLVRGYGALQYPVDLVLTHLTGKVDPEAFRFDIEDPSHQLCTVYQAGLTTGKYALDAQEFELKRVMVDSEKLKLQREKNVDAMINQFLGEDED